MSYRAADVPDQQGRTVAITGANSGIGFAAARLLAERGARVLLCCRSATKASQAMAAIHRQLPAAELQYVSLDLADLSSVQRAADELCDLPRLDVLINNAGVMTPPRTVTADGFESQFGVNHLGHFALSNRLLPKLAEHPGSRVVTVSSNAHKFGRIDFADPHAQRSYAPFRRYAMSKLANLLFTFELQRRLAARAQQTLAVACHPGGADTNLARYFPKRWYALIQPLARHVINSADEGALPTLRAATHHAVVSGDYFGPAHFFETVYSAVAVAASSRAQDDQLAGRLWAMSAELTATGN